MKTRIKRFGAAALAVGTMLTFEAAAGAQGANPGSNSRIFLVNPNPFIAPGVRLQQYAFGVAVMGQAYSNIPPYILGFNPYPFSVNYGPVYNPYGYRPALYGYRAPSYYGNVAPAVVPSMGAGYSPYVPGLGAGYSPYSPGAGYSAAASGVDPLTGLAVANAGGGYSAAGANPVSGNANQARLDTRKKYIDTLAYIRANEYTFTQQQADIAKKLLQRVQNKPTDAEVKSGKSLNVLLDDLAKWEAMTKTDGKQTRAPTLTIDGDVLRLVNLTSLGSNGNIGLLRDDGRFTWPTAFEDKDVASDKECKDIELQTQELYRQALNARPNPNTLKDLGSSLQEMRGKLSASAKSISATNYLQAQRFLDSFDAAVVALKKGDAVSNVDFQRNFNSSKGGKTVQELVAYMTSKGLRFAAAAPDDERAYYALQAALAAHSLAIHSEVAAAGGKDN